MRAPVLTFGLLTLAACGGSVVTIDGGGIDGGGDGAADAGADGTIGDASPDAPTCERLANRLGPLREAAMRCSITSPQKQCGQFAKDLCCPLAVTDNGSPAVKAFEAAVDEYLKLCPPPPCPPVACPANPSGQCGMQLTCFQF